MIRRDGSCYCPILCGKFSITLSSSRRQQAHAADAGPEPAFEPATGADELIHARAVSAASVRMRAALVFSSRTPMARFGAWRRTRSKRFLM